MADNQALDFYRLWIDDIARLRQSRQAQTNFFVSVNLAGMGALGFLLSPDHQMPTHFVFWICLAMLVVNLSWMATDAWFATITWRKILFARKLEENLEYQPLKEEGVAVNWRRRYRLFYWLGIERIMPVLFIIGFVGILLLQYSSLLPFELPGWLDGLRSTGGGGVEQALALAAAV
jgi:hypothetical protein